MTPQAEGSTLEAQSLTYLNANYIELITLLCNINDIMKVDFARLGIKIAVFNNNINNCRQFNPVQGRTVDFRLSLFVCTFRRLKCRVSHIPIKLSPFKMDGRHLINASIGI